MTIEISKKSIIRLIMSISVILISIFGGYYLGYEYGYDIGLKETTKKYETPKGNGLHFYAEKKFENLNSYPYSRATMIYHSTTNCKYIENGVKVDVVFTDSATRKNNSIFCSKCMDDYLMKKCTDFLNRSYN